MLDLDILFDMRLVPLLGLSFLSLLASGDLKQLARQNVHKADKWRSGVCVSLSIQKCIMSNCSSYVQLGLEQLKTRGLCLSKTFSNYSI